MSEIFVLFAMLFMHVLDDFVLQTAFLSKGKQKSWWEKHAPDEMYDLDFIICLIMHTISWAFMIMLPIAALNHFNVGINYMLAFFANVAIHYVVDDLKANHHKINLFFDQFIHIFQIAWTFVTLINYGVN